MPIKNVAVVLLAGSSTRFGGEKSKIFYNVKDVPLFIYPLKTLQNSESIDDIMLVCKAEDKEEIKTITNENGITKVNFIIDGGSTRSESVKNAVNFLSYLFKNDINVLICDGDRPNLTEELIQNNITGLATNDGVVTAVKAIDSTFQYVDKINYLNRSTLYNAQTPQSFKLDVLKKAYSPENYKDCSDDASLCLEAGFKIAVVEGSYSNYKITTKSDLNRFISEVENV